MTNILFRVVDTLHSGGIRAVFQESVRYFRSHPIRIWLIAKLRMLRLKFCSPYRAIADPTSLLHVNPDQINAVNSRFDIHTDIGRIVDGDWDQDTGTFTDKIRYQALYQRFVKGASWEETGIIDYYLVRIASSGRYDGCYTRADVEARYQRIDQMHSDMRDSGFDPQKGENALDHVCVHVGRDGTFLHAGNGNHRLSLAKILDIDQIPVRVVVRHRKWQLTRERVHRDPHETPELEGHPDLLDIS